MRSASPALLSVFLAAALLTGCSGSAPPEGGGASTGGSDAPASSGGSSGAGTQVQQDSGVGVEEYDTSKVLAQQKYTLPGTKDDVTFGVQSLKVDGKTMILKMVVTPDFSSVSKNETLSIYEATGENVAYFDPQLVDRGNLKEYGLIRESSTTWSADMSYTKTTNGQPVIWWGVYAAPEDDIDSVDIRVMQGVPEFTNVPIQR
ncbi:hypothetical protein GCM10009596_00600 [Arthrobacter rhombi]|uniref:hypothetical protein n=1 Tax=Arthrobacter rhombi TaxID=71253 RepID=UPI0031E46F06